jgi:hypothetical protein
MHLAGRVSSPTHAPLPHDACTALGGVGVGVDTCRQLAGQHCLPANPQGQKPQSPCLYYTTKHTDPTAVDVAPDLQASAVQAGPWGWCPTGGAGQQVWTAVQAQVRGV